MNAAEPLLRGRVGDAELTERLLAPLSHGFREWWIAVGICAAGTLVLILAIAYSVVRGVGVWGNNIPVGWGTPIIDFIWWGHAGALISACLLLLDQRWRAGVSRIAETMALVSLVNAGIFPLLHLGRIWFFYWLIPYPNSMEVWPQFRSSLTWDVPTIFVLLVVSFLFWYVGLVPDLATVRDRATGWLRPRVYGIFALGWKGSGRDWEHHRIVHGWLAGLVVVIAVLMHSSAGFDLATAVLPGWHVTLFPVYFVVRALFTGFAMVAVLSLLLRRWYRLHGVITERHLDILGTVLLALAWMVLYTYVVEIFVAWYRGSAFERSTYLVQRPFGLYAPLFWGMILLNVLVPQLLWSRRVRRRPAALAAVSLLIIAGMWLDRFMIVIGPQSQDFLPSAWSPYAPTWVDWSIFVGTLGFFGLLLLLLMRFVPLVSLSEVKELRRQLEREGP